MTSSSEPSGMDMAAIRAAIDSGDTSQRMRAITAMQPHPAEECVPLLINCLADDAFVVRSLACMGLGYKRNPQGLQALLKVMQAESDHNVRAEAVDVHHLVDAVVDHERAPACELSREFPLNL